ncbi:hypothetical protein [Acidaminococcus sp.]|uniref:hypothetical protein n=1 Tax=Acidaminococcus sp. TaxID=1872103 RepID=UPI003D7D25D7
MQLNWIYEINAFYSWSETSGIKADAMSLWHALMYTASKAGWKSEFNASANLLCARSGLSKSSFQRARNQLSQMGRIKFFSRKGNQSAVYQIVPFSGVVQYEPQTEPQIDKKEFVVQYGSQTESQTEPQPGPQSGHIPKLNQTKQNYPPTPNDGSRVLRDTFSPDGNSNGQGRALEGMGLERLVWDFTANHGLRVALGQWAAMRKEKGKPLTAAMLRRNLDDLQRLSGDVAMQRTIVEQSTRKGWTGFYPIDHIPDKKRYPKADCPRCHGEGYYLAADGHTMVECDCKDG